MMLDTLARLETYFDVRREEGYGLDKELERDYPLARASVRLTPANQEAAPITVAFTDFPGLYLRFELWWTEPLPDCLCDACDPHNSVEGLTEELTELIEDITAGRFRESHNPSKRWKTRELWGASGWRRGGSLTAGNLPHRQVNWKPWPRRQDSPC